jgi:hypothetical protein
MTRLTLGAGINEVCPADARRHRCHRDSTPYRPRVPFIGNTAERIVDQVDMTQK